MRIMLEHRFSPAAERDLADIWHYINKQWSKEQANRCTLGLKAIGAKLSDALQQGQGCTTIHLEYP
ncbi:type II toxin-antitoxin system RelE/ParE family toxin [Sphingobium fuliginis]|uniref:type II toxin-antitoxin system RelE/ParE family toxin n=1 Tax=Sphingobium fuliginis (strain ATCC 27551) TaxID=336203 RepID=UPI000C08AED7